MSNKFDGLFDKHISKLDMAGVEPVCENVHPLIHKLLAELYASEDAENAWHELLTDLEKQMRVCLTNEMHDLIFNGLPPAVQKHLEPYWNGISHYILTIAWLSARAIKPEFGE